jgi:ubiquinol-cytochrome c reductase cytochrome c subunit
MRHSRVIVGSLAVALGAFAVAVLAQPPRAQPQAAPSRETPLPPDTAQPTPLQTEGRALFEEGCSSCHGFEGDGVPGQGPSLLEAGEAAADFYLRTGRMPLDQVGKQPLRGEPHYSEAEIRALVSYVGSLGGGPKIPVVHPEQGSLSEGMRLFTESCAGCHGTGGKGGVAIGAYAPPLGESTPTDVAEAIRIGPYVMPRFSEAQLDQADLDSIARYVQLTQDPDDAGGWGIGHIGPVPEGLVAWFAAIAALLLIARLIGERSETDRGGEKGELP